MELAGIDTVAIHVRSDRQVGINEVTLDLSVAKQVREAGWKVWSTAGVDLGVEVSSARSKECPGVLSLYVSVQVREAGRVDRVSPELQGTSVTTWETHRHVLVAAAEAASRTESLVHELVEDLLQSARWGTQAAAGHAAPQTP